MEVDVDGSPVDAGAAVSASDGGTSRSTYVSVRRLWEGTTVVTVRLEMELHAELLPDGSPWVSFLYGPVVLAARDGDDGVGSFEAPDERMGHVASGTLLPLAGTPVVAGPEPLDAVVAPRPVCHHRGTHRGGRRRKCPHSPAGTVRRHP